MPTTTTARAGSAVSDRVAGLRELATTDDRAARDELWSWYEEEREAAGKDRRGAIGRLDELFKLGTPPEGLDGQTKGMLVTFTVQPLLDRAIGGLTSSWMPWMGKRFDAGRDKGVNLLTNSARWPSKVLWPLYGTRDHAEGRLAFDFDTRVEPGKLDPEVDVLVIDYEPVTSNPRLLIRSIRDELVQIVPGGYLGKMLYHLPRDRYTNACFFALRDPS